MIANQPITAKRTFDQAERWLETLFRRAEFGELRLVINGNEQIFRGAKSGVIADLTVYNPLRMAASCLMRGDIGLAESYMAGDWESSNLSSLLMFLADNEAALSRGANMRWWGKLGVKMFHWLHRNNRQGSRRNIAYHYDLGNDFYRLWLDSSMTYSAPIYSRKNMNLPEAQDAKYQRILDQCATPRGSRFLEIGCGWGGFAEKAASAGHQVHAVTLSEEQLAYARRRVPEGAFFELRDYRSLEDQYDAIVSIEMFEAVGMEYWDTYFQILWDRLKPGGRAVLQIITIDEAYFENYSKTPDFIQRYIFPGGMLPDHTSLDRLIDQQGFELRDRYTFGQDYARVLREWHDRFDASRNEVRELGYDDRFIAMWKYYLAYCEAGFRTGRIDVCQISLQKPG